MTAARTGTESLTAALRPAVALRELLVRSTAELDAGRPADALATLAHAREIAESPGGGELDRAEVYFRLGCARLALGSPANAVSLLTLALEACERAPQLSDRLRTNILDWRSRCYRRQRDWQAARADVERALELAHDLGDPRVIARVCMQASIIAERERQWLLARFYAEQARDLFRELGETRALARMLNNLGGIHFLNGDTDEAVACLHEALELSLGEGRDLDAGYALSSLAQVRLRTGDASGAEIDARQALGLLGGRPDHANEVANAELVLARALIEQHRHAEARAAADRAEAAVRDFGSPSHSAAAWLAGGDVARASGDLERAADLYRRAAEALQDLNF